ncbi:MAG: hypothetical protein IPJ40_05170 [Saprospirales bacterium]|nr:hypothetical protein [Saprospirales bacterium]
MNRYGFIVAFVLGGSLLSCHLFQKSSMSEPALPPVPSERPLITEQIDSLPSLPLPAPASILVRIKQVGCGGPCPEWEARFYANGIATFIGLNGSIPQGAYSLEIPEDMIANWQHQAEDILFFSLPDSIPASESFLPELPTWEIEIRNDSLLYRVVHNHHGTVSLRTFEQQLESWIFSLPWERIQ